MRACARGTPLTSTRLLFRCYADDMYTHTQIEPENGPRDKHARSEFFRFLTAAILFLWC